MELKKMTVKEVMSQFENIFDSVTYFIPLNIHSSDLYLMWVLKYSSFKYISDDYDEIKSYVDILSKIYSNRFTKSVNALLTEYNPIENYNSTETENIEISGENSSTSENSTTATGENTTNTTGETTETLSPYDSENFNNNSKNNSSGVTTEKSSSSDSSNNTMSGTSSQSNNRTLKRSGNIGVTTSQQMIQSELELRKNDLINDFFNIVQNYILSHNIL